MDLDANNLSTIAELKALPEGTTQVFNSVLLLNKATVRTARNGSEFLVVELADKSGSLTINCFSNSTGFEFFKTANSGHVVHIEAQTDYYQSKLSPRLLAVMEVPEAIVERDCWLEKLIESAPEGSDWLWSEMQRFIQMIKNPRLRATVDQVITDIEDSFKTGFGAIAIHHAYRNGLMEHTVHIARAAEVLLPLYKEVHPDLAIAGILLHDTGKVLEYTQGRVAKKNTHRRTPRARCTRVSLSAQSSYAAQTRARPHRTPRAHHPRPPRRARMGRSSYGGDPGSCICFHGRQSRRQNGNRSTSLEKHP